MTSRLVLFALLLLPLLPAGPACASKIGKKDSFPEAPSIVQQAEALGRTDRDEALAVLEGYLKSGEDKSLMPWVTMAAGEQRRLNGEHDAARDHFEALVRTWPEHATADAAKLGMALVAIQSRKDSGNTWATLELIAVEHVPDTMNADRFRLLALKAQREAKDPAVIAQLADQARSFAAADPVTLAAVGTELVGLGVTTAAGVDAAPPAAGDVAALARAQENLKRKDMKAAVAEANALLKDYPTSPLAEHARWVIKRAEAGDPYKPLTIGVLLPLTGEYAPPGKQLKDALTLAVQDAGGGVTLVFKDSAGDPAKATAAFEALVLKDGVAAVIGPLLKEEVFPVAAQAQAAGVPLLTLTQAPDVTDAGDYVFRGYLTTEQQVAGLLEYVMVEKGMQRFAVLAPDNAYGQHARDTFAAQVAARGGEVKVTVMYPPEANDFRKQAAELGQKNYDARRAELARLKREAEAKGMNPDKVVLPPNQDFEAIFIPDNYSRVALVGASLAYEEFAVGSFRPTRGSAPIPLLGLNGYHNAELPKRGGAYVSGCYFVDAFDPKNGGVEALAFSESFQRAYNRTPTVMEATAYDAGRLMATAARSGAADREALRAALNGAQLGAPVSGASAFDAERELQRAMMVFSVRGGAIVRVDDDVPEEAPPTP